MVMNFKEKSEITEICKEGEAVEVQQDLILANREDARTAFENGRKKMLDINNWNKYVEGVVSELQLIHDSGELADASAAEGDYIRIDIPGRGSEIGYGYDWVRIEQWEEEDQEEFSSITFTVYPIADPQQKKEGVAHFYSGDSSATFRLRRERNLVTVSVREDNLTINPLAERSVAGTMRQALIGDAGLFGYTPFQWKQLTSALLVVNTRLPDRIC